MPGTPPLTSPDNLPRIGDMDSPDIPRDMNALADATQLALRGRGGAFANALERDAYYAAAGLPSEGALVWLADKEYYTYYHDGKWIYAYATIVRRDTDANLANGEGFTIPWESAGTQPAETTGMAWSSAGIVVPKTGIYSIQFVVAHRPSLNCVAWTQVLKNSVDPYVISTNIPAIGGTQNQTGITQLQILEKGSIITGRITCDASGTNFLAASLGLNSIPMT